MFQTINQFTINETRLALPGPVSASSGIATGSTVNSSGSIALQCGAALAGTTTVSGYAYTYTLDEVHFVSRATTTAQGSLIATAQTTLSGYGTMTSHLSPFEQLRGGALLSGSSVVYKAGRVPFVGTSHTTSKGRLILRSSSAVAPHSIVLVRAEDFRNGGISIDINTAQYERSITVPVV